MPCVSVVIPCLNEAETLEKCILKCQRAFSQHQLTGEIIVADNGSHDGSQEIAKRCGARVVNIPEKGYGAALIGGIAQSNGTYVIMGDADDSYNFLEIFPFIEKLNEGFDMVIGCRFPSGGGQILPTAMPWLHRWIGNPTLSCIGRLFFKAPVTDFYCGLRGFRKDSISRLKLKATGMVFAYEMIIKAAQHEMKITEVPITLYKDGRSRRPHLRTWRDGWRTLVFMFKMKFYDQNQN